MNIKITLCLLLGVAWGLSQTTVRADHGVFGRAGSGEPTKTVVGILGGAALGSAIGQAVDGGGDGWWIGALTGSVVGGAAGNAWGSSTREDRDGSYYADHSYRGRSYRSHHSHYHRSYGYPEEYSYYDDYVEPVPVVYERQVIIERVPVVIVPSVEEQREAARREAVLAVWPVETSTVHTPSNSQEKK